MAGSSRWKLRGAERVGELREFFLFFFCRIRRFCEVLPSFFFGGFRWWTWVFVKMVLGVFFGEGFWGEHLVGLGVWGLDVCLPRGSLS